MFSTKLRLWLLLAPIIIWLLFFLLGIISDFDVNTTNLNSFKVDSLVYNSSAHAFWTILRNNILIVVINIIGFTSFGLYSLLSVILNGYFLGFLISNTFGIEINCQEIILNIIPHGILEIIGLWISVSAGIHSTIIFIKIIKGAVVPKIDFIFYLKLAFISIILTILSAYIEAFYTLSEYL